MTPTAQQQSECCYNDTKLSEYAVDDAEIRAAMVAAGDLDNSDERLPAQHAIIDTS
jgi:hypothetical protein